LGLNLSKIEKKEIKIPEKIKKLIKEREEARKKKDFAKADELRGKINKEGYIIEDSEKDLKIKKK
jgi:cysteinyl-tRNA synthetase